MVGVVERGIWVGFHRPRNWRWDVGWATAKVEDEDQRRAIPSIVKASQSLEVDRCCSSTEVTSTHPRRVEVPLQAVKGLDLAGSWCSVVAWRTRLDCTPCSGSSEGLVVEEDLVEGSLSKAGEL